MPQRNWFFTPIKLFLVKTKTVRKPEKKPIVSHSPYAPTFYAVFDDMMGLTPGHAIAY